MAAGKSRDRPPAPGDWTVPGICPASTEKLAERPPVYVVSPIFFCSWELGDGVEKATDTAEVARDFVAPSISDLRFQILYRHSQPAFSSSVPVQVSELDRKTPDSFSFSITGSLLRLVSMRLSMSCYCETYTLWAHGALMALRVESEVLRHQPTGRFSRLRARHIA